MKALVAAQPGRFYMPAYVASKGWVALRLDVGEVDWGEVAELVACSYRFGGAQAPGGHGEGKAMTPTLETPRLWLRPLALVDAEQAQPLFAQWEVVKHLSDRVPWPFPPDGVLNFYRDVALPQTACGEAWHWTLRPKSDPDRMIGAISLQKSDEINRGFWLALEWHGQGLMSEACHAATNYWFETLRFPLLRVTKAAANTASRRISEKQGMRMVGTKEGGYVCGRLLTEVWEITAEEWRKLTQTAGISSREGQSSSQQVG